MLITVTTTTDPIQAHIISGRLEAEGLQPSIAFEHHVRMNWFISNALGGIRVQVPPSQQEQALDVVSLINDRSYQQLLEQEEETRDDLACPACGSRDVRRSRFTESLALLVLWFMSLPIPFQTGAYNCQPCKHHWLSQAGKAYNTDMLFFAGLFAALIVAILIFIFTLIYRFVVFILF